MPGTADRLPITTDGASSSIVLDEVLRELYVGGSVLLRERYRGRWGVDIPSAAALAGALRAPEGTLCVAFHFVEFGRCEIRPAIGRALVLRTGDLAICFGGVPHVLGCGHVRRAVPVASLLTNATRMRQPRRTDDGAETGMLCGAFTLRRDELNPLFAALPGVVTARVGETGALHRLSGVTRLLVEEVSRGPAVGGYVKERLLDILCAEVIRAYAESEGAHPLGWFRGLRDPAVGRALAAVHRKPSAAWTVARLASVASLSPSRFAARFVSCLGVSPMAYVTNWRMALARRQLTVSHDAVEAIGVRVGYDSLPVFSRAFKRVVGVSPGRWRSEL